MRTPSALETVLASLLILMLPAVPAHGFTPAHVVQQPGSVNTNGTVDLSGQACNSGSVNNYSGAALLPSLQLCDSTGHYVTSPVVRAFGPDGTPINGVKFILGSGTLTLGRATVNLTNGAVFSSATSYTCSVTDTSGVITLISVVSRNSGSQFVVGTVSLGLSDPFTYECAGN